MPGIRSMLTPQDLALHDAGELLPESGDILREDIEDGRVVVCTRGCTSSVKDDTTHKTVKALENKPK